MAQNLDELFDVVDAQDRVTGQLARREVHLSAFVDDEDTEKRTRDF